MKIINKAIVVLALGLAIVGHAQAQLSSTTNVSNPITTNAASTAANEGVNNTNNFNSVTPTDVTEHVKYSGVTGSNTAVGLGSFSSSFSSDYCGGTAQAGVSVPYITAAAGGPVLKEPGVACVNTRGAVHTMEFSATYGNAATKSFDLAAAYDKLGNPSPVSVTKPGVASTDIVNPEQAANYRKVAADLRTSAAAYADQSMKLAAAATNMLCNLSDDVRQAYRDAGVMCPETKQEKQDRLNAETEQRKQQAVANSQPTDPFVRSRMGLPALQ